MQLDDNHHRVVLRRTETDFDESATTLTELCYMSNGCLARPPEFVRAF